MSLLTIIKDAAAEIGIPAPATVIGNTQVIPTKLLRYANKTGVALMKEPRSGWQMLRKESSFTAIAGETQTGFLPSDFDRFVPETMWNRDDVFHITGPIGAVEWQGLKANNYNDPARKFIKRGNAILMVPIFKGGESIAFEYVSNEWCQSSGGTGQTAWAADTDVGVLDEELMTRGVIYQYLESEGLPSAIAAESFNSYCDLLLENDQEDADILVAADIFSMNSRHFNGAPAVSGTENVV